MAVRRRQRALMRATSGPAEVTLRGLPFSDSSDSAGREQVDSLSGNDLGLRRLSRLENPFADRLESGDPLDFRRGTGRTFRPVQAGPAFDQVPRRPKRAVVVSQLSPLARSSSLRRASSPVQGHSAPRPLQTGLPFRPVARLDRRSLVCFHRRVRRGVLFALRVAGRSGGSPGRNNRYRHSVDSAFSCG